MLLLLDIGNTHTHVGIAKAEKILRQMNFRTKGWRSGATAKEVIRFIQGEKLEGACFCSVVPSASPHCARFLRGLKLDYVELNAETLRGVGINYPKPKTIGADRLANALAVKTICGAPALVVDFGTAVTFDVVDRRGNYIGGIIAPGLSAMTDYLHEKTALLPRITVREPGGVIGKNTEQAMLIGAVHGYRGLIRGLIAELKRELGARKLPVIATGGYAELIADAMPEIREVHPSLTLEGLRLTWQNRSK
ncbi:MAG TPA: type III pantothenate kinase [Candidatus Kapabacteria bacterium]|nr:type III pantothenate kinase [Candidatus Kapabacteria bacterium]